MNLAENYTTSSFVGNTTDLNLSPLHPSPTCDGYGYGIDDFTIYGDWSHAIVDDGTTFEPSMEIGQELLGNYLAVEAFAASVGANQPMYDLPNYGPSSDSGASSMYDIAFSPIPPTTPTDPYPPSCDVSLSNHDAYTHQDVLLPPDMTISPFSYVDYPVAPNACISPALLNAPGPQVACSHECYTHTCCAVSSVPYPQSSSTSSSYSPSPSPSPTSPKRTLFPCSRRNVKVSSSDPSPSPVKGRANPWKCPHCPYVQRNKRSPDLKRHIATHTRPTDVELWVCCGVPVGDAVEHCVPTEVAQSETPFEYEGLLMVGGCRKTFSRRDALKRHLKREKGRCYGDALALYLPGNSRLGEEQL